MKQFIKSAAIVLFMSGFSVYAADNFKVKIHLKNLGEQVKGSFRQISPDGFKTQDISSVNDGYIITGEVDAPELVTIFLSDKRITKTIDGKGYIPSRPSRMDFFVYPGAEVVIDGEITDYINAYPSGDKENELLSTLHKELYPVLNEAVNIYVRLGKEKALSEQEKKELSLQYEQLNEKGQQIRKTFLNKYASSWAALALMEDMLIRSQINMDEIEKLLPKVNKEYQSLSYYKSVKKRYEGFKSTQIGKAAPVIKTNATPNGAMFDLADLRGKYVILDFWGTWCGACIAGMPEMKAFRDKHADKVEIVGIAKDRSMEQWRKFVEARNMDWPNIFNGKDDQNYVELFSVQGYPTKVVIDPKGNIVYRMTGERPEFYEEVEKLIKSL